MTRNLHILVLVLSLIILTSFSGREKEKKKDTTVKQQIEIPLKTTKPNGIGHYYITVIINDVEVDLLVDCGSIGSFLDINQSRKLDFNYVSTESTYRGIGGLQEDYRVYKYRTFYGNDELYVGYRGVDIHELMIGFNKKYGTNMVGILGSNFFTATHATIDFHNRILIITQ
jgi:hypothetical protein